MSDTYQTLSGSHDKSYVNFNPVEQVRQMERERDLKRVCFQVNGWLLVPMLGCFLECKRVR